MSQPSLKLYGVPASQPVRSVLWLLEINSIPYELVKMSPMWPKKNPKKMEYIKTINPLGRVPSLQDTDNGVILYESGAILAYIANKYDLDDWYPNHKKSSENLQRRGKIDSYLHWHHENTRLVTVAYIAPLLRADVPLERWMKNVSQMVHQRKALKYVLNAIEKEHLGNGQLYLIDDKPSVADLLCYQEIIQFKEFDAMYPYSKFKVEYPNIDQWLTRMSKLPAHKKVHKILDKLQPFIKQRVEATKPLQEAIASKL